MEAEPQHPSPPPLPPPHAPAIATPHPPIWPVFIGLLGALVLGIFGTVVVVVLVALALAATGGADDLASSLPKRLTSDPLLLLAQMLPFALALGLVAVLLPLIERRRIADALGLSRPGLSPAQWLMLIAGSFVPFALGIGCAYFMPSLGDGAKLVDMWRTMPPATAVAWVLLIGLVPGFCEEMFFRGFMQRRLLARWRPSVAIGVTSLCFAVMHIDPAAAAMAFVLGVWLGIVAWRTGSIRPTIAIHASINSGWNAAQIMLRRSDPSAQDAWLVLGPLLLVCVACFAASVVLLVKRADRPPPPPLPASP